jgi:hypothetical protein
VGVVVDEVVVGRAVVVAERLEVARLADLVRAVHELGRQRVADVVGRRAAAAGDPGQAALVELHVVGDQSAGGLRRREVLRDGVLRLRAVGQVDDVEARARAREVGVPAAVHARRGVAGPEADRRVAGKDRAGRHLPDDLRRGRVGDVDT